MPQFKTHLLLACSLLIVPLDAQSLTHRWSFNSTGPATNGSVILDAISGAPGIIVGSGATRNGSALALPGTTNGVKSSATISAYFDLPNGIISSKSAMTLEIWATIQGAKDWQRLFDFGSLYPNDDPNGEIGAISNAPPAGTTSSSDLMLAVQRGSSLATQQLTARLGDAAEIKNLNSVPLEIGTRYHFVVTFEAGVGVHPATGGRLSWYRDGTFVGSLDTDFSLSQLNDVNNWLGRSQFTNDNNSKITYDEFRLHDHALTAAEITASGVAGPDKVFPAPVANPDSVTLHRGQKILIDPLANDAGEIALTTLAIEQAPQFGSAVVTADHRILYSQTTDSPTSDSFTYRVSNTTGQSSTGQVTLNFAETLRIPNPNLNVPANPPVTNLSLVNALPGLTFSQPVCLRTPPGDSRLFVCEKTGILQIVPFLQTPSPFALPFLNLPTLLGSRGESLETGSESGLLSVAFHPSYATNRTFYVFYSVKKGSNLYQRVSRFTTKSANPNEADPTSEQILINQLDEAGNHNGGDMHFGPDGYLYISLGDEGHGDDTFNNSQTITKDFFSAILRIDVDLEGNEIVGGNPAAPDDANLVPQVHASIPLYPPVGGKPAFEVPIDNPYVYTGRGGMWNGTFNGSPATPLSKVRDEFWAVGLRNPWRMSFDPVTDELWCADVGQNVLEEIDIIQKGKNYGWAYREANNNGPKAGSAPANFDALFHTKPIYQYDRNTPNFNGYSVTGGVVYRGTGLPSLTGKYIFGDYGSGNIWSLKRNGNNPPTVERIIGESGIAAFGIDPTNQDLLLANINSGRIQRLVSSSSDRRFPTTLSATGLFADLTDLSPAPGLLPYSVNLPFWSDHADKSRWFIIPDGISTLGWSKEFPWSLPAGTIWVKHFDMIMNRNPSPPAEPIRKRIETRLIVKNAGGVYGVSYRWNEAGTEAFLANDGGEDLELDVSDHGSPAPQTWHIPSRAECLTCHTPQGGYALSFNTRQLNLDHEILGFAGNQLQTLKDNAFFSGADPGPPDLLPRHLRPDETAFSVEGRVRSYLDVNCSYCHQAGGSASTTWDTRAHLSLAETGLIRGNVSNNGGTSANKLIVPGNITRSIVPKRMAASNGFTRMPPLASNVIDTASVALLESWITGELVTNLTYDAWRLARFGSSSSAEGAADQDPDHDGMDNYSEFLAGTQPKDASSALKPQLVSSGGNVKLSFTLPPNRSFTVKTSSDLGQWTPWEIPGNQGLPVAGGTIELTQPQVEPSRFFRVEIRGN